MHQAEAAEVVGRGPAEADIEIAHGVVGGDLDGRAGRRQNDGAAGLDGDAADDGEVLALDGIVGADFKGGAPGRNDFGVGKTEGEIDGGVIAGEEEEILIVARIAQGTAHDGGKLVGARNGAGRHEIGEERLEIVAQFIGVVAETGGAAEERFNDAGVGLEADDGLNGVAPGVGGIAGLGIDSENFVADEILPGGLPQKVGPILAVGIAGDGAHGIDDVANAALRRGAPRGREQQRGQETECQT